MKKGTVTKILSYLLTTVIVVGGLNLSSIGTIQVHATDGYDSISGCNIANGPVTICNGDNSNTFKLVQNSTTILNNQPATEPIIISGSSGSNSVNIVTIDASNATSANVPQIILSDLTIDASGGAPISVVTGQYVNFILRGTNSLSVQTVDYAGLQVPEGATITISEDATNSSTVTDSLSVTGGGNAAGIGGGYHIACGIVTINSGTITAVGCNAIPVGERAFGDAGAGIGGGGKGAGGIITINGGIINATGGDLIDSNGDDIICGGTGIGGGYGRSGGVITINNGTVTARGGGYSAGIGGGMYYGCGTVTINGGTVIATGGKFAAGIGGGCKAGFANMTSDGGSVTINGGSIQATGGAKGAGIGNGQDRIVGTSIIICGGTINASGGENADGIGEAAYYEEESVTQLLTIKPVADKNINVWADNSTSTLTIAQAVSGSPFTDTTGTDIKNQVSGKRYFHSEVRNNTDIMSFDCTANGSDLETSSIITLTFRNSSNNLADISGIESGSVAVNGATAGTITKTAETTGTYTVNISDIIVNDGQTITVTPTSDVYLFSPVSKSVAVRVVTPVFTVSNATVSKDTDPQTQANFILTSPNPVPEGSIWKVYGSASGGSTLSNVTATVSGSTLTLSHATNLPEQTYHVSVTETGKKESNRVALTVGAHTHSYGSNWQTSTTQHWYECACGAKQDEAAHDFIWVTDTKASIGVPGTKHEECATCGYRRNEGTVIPALTAPSPTQSTTTESTQNQIQNQVQNQNGNIEAEKQKLSDLTKKLLNGEITGNQENNQNVVNLVSDVQIQINSGKAQIDVSLPKAVLDTINEAVKQIDEYNKKAEKEGKPIITLPITLTLPADSLLKQLDNSGIKELSLDITVSNSLLNHSSISLKGIYVDLSVIKKAITKNIGLCAAIRFDQNGKPYIWNFDGKLLEEYVKNGKPLNLLIKDEILSNKEKRKYGNNGKRIEFQQEGIFPTVVKFSVPTSKDPGSKIYLYYHNTESGRIDMVPNNVYTVDSQSNVDLLLIHASEYILSDKKLTRGVTGLLKQIEVPNKNVMCIGESNAEWCQLPLTLSPVKEFTNDISPAMAEVKLTFKNSKPNVASVDENGVITAKQVGSTTITMTAVLADKSSKSFKMKVTVKKADLLQETLNKQFYTVIMGDTLGEIAKKFNVAINKLVECNNLEDPDYILTGQKLEIPQ